MPETVVHVISSAVVTVMPHRADAVRKRLAAIDNVDVALFQGTKIVIVLEARARNSVGARLAEIALMDGVVSANMVFEHVEEECA